MDIPGQIQNYFSGVCWYGGGGEDKHGEYIAPYMTCFMSMSPHSDTPITAPADRMLSFAARNRVRIWTNVANGMLGKWTTTNQKRLGDLSAFGLTPQGINDLVSRTKLVNYVVLLAQDRQALNVPKEADFTALPGSSFNLIIYNMVNYGQYTFSEAAGTLVHEYVHLRAPDLQDIHIQSILGLPINDHSNISEKFADDCFGGAAIPTLP